MFFYGWKLFAFFSLFVLVSADIITYINQSDTTYPWKTNFCGELLNVVNKSLAFSDVLKGRTVNLGLRSIDQTFPIFIKRNLSSGYPNGGYFYDVWQALAEQGGFKINWLQLPPNPPTQPGTTYLTRFCPHVDFIGGDWYSITSARQQAGLGFTYPVVDASLILVAEQSTIQVKSLWNFTLPFSNSLWYLVGGTLMFSGILYWLLSEKREEDEFEGTVNFFVFQSFNAFANGSGFEPGQLRLQLAHIGLGFLVMILLASYTANLASYLISSATVQASLSSIDDANLRGLKICVAASSTAQIIIGTYYPRIRLVPLPNPAHYRGMSQGLCEGTVVAMVDWDVAKVNIESNPDCNLGQVGGVIRTFSGAFPFKADYQDKCTTFLNDVISTSFLDLNQRGAIDALWQNSLASVTSISCAATASDSTSSELSIDDLAGVWCVYCIFIACSLVVTAVDFYRGKFTPRFCGTSTSDKYHPDKDAEKHVENDANIHADIDCETPHTLENVDPTSHHDPTTRAAKRKIRR